MGDHVFKGFVEGADGSKQDVEFVFKVEEGGIISSQEAGGAYTLNGVVQDGKLTLKQQFEGEGALEAQFDGEFETATKIKGTFESNNQAAYPGNGAFELNKQ